MFTTRQLQRNLGITHPSVRDAYLKTVSNPDHTKFEDVLVLETYHEDGKQELDGFDSYLIELLNDLEDLKNKAEAKVGHIDRVDICHH